MNNLTFCGYCGGAISENHAFCTSCGKAKPTSGNDGPKTEYSNTETPTPQSAVELPVVPTVESVHYADSPSTESAQTPVLSNIHTPESLMNNKSNLKVPIAIASAAFAVVAIVVVAILLIGDLEPDTAATSTTSPIAARWDIEHDVNSDIGERWGVESRTDTGSRASSSIEREIQETLDWVSEAYSRGDFAAIADVFGQDVAAVFGGALPILDDLVGFDINDMSQAMFGFGNLFGEDLGLGEMPTMTMTVNSVTELSDGLVSVNVTTTMSASGSTETETGEIIMRQERGEWVFAFDMMR